ncbi:MAG: tetratricopeptide repeat protein, partial [Myxococcota bacterium]
MGDELVERGRCEEAIAAYSEALAEDDALIEAYLGRGSCHEQRQEWDKAGENYAAALRLEKSERTLVALAKVRIA